MDELKLLLEDGNVGFYRSCEAVQLFLFDRDNKTAHNLYTLYVFEDFDCTDSRCEYLGNRISVDDQFFVGIMKRRIAIDDAIDAYQILINNQCSHKNKSIDLKIEGSCSIGKIKKRLRQFVPPNKSIGISLNRVLKKNFYNGSYILEFFDIEKTVFNYTKKEKLIAALKTASECIPIHLDLLLDRIGNIVFQFPSVLINVSANTKSEYIGNAKKLIPQEIELRIRRDRRIKDYLLRITVTNETDNVITGAYIGETVITAEHVYPGSEK